jgi:hypothetical protein
VYEKSLEMRHFRVCPYPDEAELAPSSAARAARDGKDGKKAPTEAAGCIIGSGREAKTEILDYHGLAALLQCAVQL